MSRQMDATAVVSHLQAECETANPMWDRWIRDLSASIAEPDLRESAQEFIERIDAARYETQRAHKIRLNTPIVPATPH